MIEMRVLGTKSMYLWMSSVRKKRENERRELDTPYPLKEQPLLHCLRVWGCLAYMHVQS